MATIVNCDGGCDIREIDQLTNYDGGAWGAGTSHGCGQETKEFETSPLLRFDFSAEIPNVNIVSAASLFLYVTSHYELGGINIEDYTFYIFKCLRVWKTDEATWNIWKAANNWQAAGAEGVLDMDVGVSASYTGPNLTGAWLEINVLDLVNDVQGNGQILNIVVDGAQVLLGDPSVLMYFFNSYTADSNKPYLSITHEGGEPPTGGRRFAHVVSRLGLPSLPDGWMRRRGLLVPAGA